MAWALLWHAFIVSPGVIEPSSGVRRVAGCYLLLSGVRPE